MTLTADEALALLLHGELGAPSPENRSEVRTAAGIPVVHRDEDGSVADEFFVRDEPPAAVLAAIAAYGPAPSHLITLTQSPGAALAAYRAAGYAEHAAETLMARPLADLPPRNPRYTVTRATPDDFAWLNAHDPAGRAWLTLSQLQHPRLRHAFIALDGRPVARVRSYQLDAQQSYVTHLYTAPTHRRQGLARALMAQLLHDAAAAGERWSLLVASAAGRDLYAALGYRACAQLTLLAPA